MYSTRSRLPGAWWILCLFLAACTQVPVTGRSQLKIIPDSTLNSMSAQQYDEFLAGHKLSKDMKWSMTVKRVGMKLKGAVEKFYMEQNQSDALDGYAWEFNLVEDTQINAWCMPGGKVVVYTGLLPVAGDETGLAVVMGHEIAHAIANHGNERMSQVLLAQMGGVALNVALDEEPEETKALFMAAYGLGAQVGVLLPYSRLHENEADHLGLIFMAMAGYDPGKAVGFWERMASQKQGGAPPEFLSTHPSDQTRIQKIKELIPEAMKYYGGN